MKRRYGPIARSLLPTRLLKKFGTSKAIKVKEQFIDTDQPVAKVEKWKKTETPETEYLSSRTTSFKKEYRSYGLTKTPDNLIVLRPTPKIGNFTGRERFELLNFNRGGTEGDSEESSSPSTGNRDNERDGFYSERKYRTKYYKFKPSTPNIAKMPTGNSKNNLGKLKKPRILRESSKSSR